MLRHVKGPRTGQPFILEPWQRDLVRTLFGWRRPDGSRRFRRAYVQVPRKNGKTTLLAGIVAYCFFCERQSLQGAQLYSAAAKRDQAALVFDTFVSFLHSTPALKALTRHNKTHHRVNRIHHGVLTNTFYTAIPADAGTAHGLDATFLACDELHAWKGREFYDVLQTSVGARPEPLAVDITTSGYDRLSICWTQHEYSIGVRDLQIDDPAYLPMIYEHDPADDWRDETSWKKVNPNYGISVDPQYMRGECRRAQTQKSYENTFRRLHLNEWTSQESRFLPMHAWRDCRGVVDPDELQGQLCYGGLDLASTTDVTAWVLCFPAGDGGYRVLPRFFIPAGRADTIEHDDRVPYALWIREGLVIATPGQRVDYAMVEEQILRDANQYGLKQVGYDPWNAEATRGRLESEGIVCVQMRQGAKTLSAPMKELERSVIDGTLEHAGNPVLEWMAENTVAHSDSNGNIKPVRPLGRESGKKIDGIVALIMAMGLAMHRQEDPEFDLDCFVVRD